MRNKKVTTVVEASSTGFGTYSKDIPGITGYGHSIEEAKQDIKDAVQAVLDHHEKKGGQAPASLNGGNLTWEYQYDFASLFKYFPLDVTSFANHIKINPSLLRQYKSGHAKASDKQKAKIQEGLHQLAHELLSVRL